MNQLDDTVLNYGPAYYASHCGPLPYERSAHWLQFFGGIADELVRAFAPRRAFDAGCAHGFLVEALWDRGVETYGRDISDFAISQVRADIRSFCEVGSIAEPIVGSYDLITCIEVLEHMPAAEAEGAIAAMTAAAPVILFSSSPTDLDEPTHVNVRPTIYWLRAFAAHGFAPLANFDAGFVAPHAFVLRRRDRVPSDEELLGFASQVRLRVQVAERNHRIAEFESQLGRAAAEASAARADAEAARVEAETARAETHIVRAEIAAEHSAAVMRLEVQAQRQRDALARKETEVLHLHELQNAERQEIARIAAMRATERDEIAHAAAVERAGMAQVVVAKEVEIARLNHSIAEYSAFSAWVRRNPLFLLIWLTNRLWYGEIRDIPKVVWAHLRHLPRRLPRRPARRISRSGLRAGNDTAKSPRAEPVPVTEPEPVPPPEPEAPIVEPGETDPGRQHDELPSEPYTPPVGLLPWFNPLRIELVAELASRPHLNVLLPGLAMNHMSGGPKTAINLAYRLAALGVRVRFISTDAALDPDPSAFWDHARALTGIEESLHRATLVDGSNRDVALQVGENDVFMATAWWTAQMAKYIVPRTRHSRFVYLIQDYESLMHPASTQSALCEETYDLDYVPVVNTSLLAEFLASSKIGRFADPEFAAKAIVFEPAVDTTRFFPDASSTAASSSTQARPRRLLFYARPTKGVRNLFELGVAALQKAVAERGIDVAEWEFVGMGEAFVPVQLGRGAVLQPAPWLGFDDYARLMRESDVLLSLMLSPHPSYPPLEMAACGKPVVTTVYANKTAERLSGLSRHIIPVGATVEDIAAGLGVATARALQGSPGGGPDLDLPSRWSESFGEALPRLHNALVGLFDPPRLPRPKVKHWPEWFPGYQHWPCNHFDLMRLAHYRDRRDAYPDAEPGLISFITPVWNTDPRFVEMLAQAVLNQDCGHGFEWVLLDNAPTRPDTIALLERLAARPGVRLIRVAENLGIVGGLRRCLEEARHRYIVPLDADDLITPDCVRVLTSALRRAGYPTLAYTDEDKAEENEFREPYCKPDWDPVLFVHSCYISHLCAIDREMALSLGCYTDRAPEGSSDWDTFMRFFLAGHVPHHVPEVLYTWRMHPRSTAGDIHSKDYIFSSQKHVIEKFVASSARPDAYRVELSPLFANTPDWRIVPASAEDRAITTILVGGNDEQVAACRRRDGANHRVAGLRDPADLAGLLRLVEGQGGRLVHLLSADVAIEDDTWAQEAATLFELYPDAVQVGGRLHHEGEIIAADGYFGFGGGWDSPNVGRGIQDSGYFVQMLKPHSTNAVSSFHCVVRADFLGKALRRLIGTVVMFDTLGLWLGAAAATQGRRVIYSPFLFAKADRLPGSAPPAERAAFWRAYGQLIPDTARFSPRLSLTPAKAYLPITRAERAAEEAALAPADLPSYADLHAAELLARRVRTHPPASRCRFALLTLLYARSPADLFRATARSALDQTLPFAEWIILENGPVPDEITAALDELGGDPRIHRHRTESLGIIGGLRYCLDRARADFIVPLDGDDVLTIDALEHLALGLLDECRPSFVFSDEDIISGDKLASPFRRGAFDPVLNIADSYVWHACAFRRDRALALGVYSDPRANFCHDWDSITRFASAGEPILHVPHVLYHWRKHASSSSNSGQTNPGSLASVRHVLERSIVQQHRPELYEVAPFPISRGAEQLAILRRPVSPLPLGLLQLGAGSPSSLPPEFQALLAQQVTLADLHALTVEYVAVLADTCAPSGDGGCWEAMRLWEMHQDVAVIGGRILDKAGIIVASCTTLDGSSYAGVHRNDPGPYAMALKPQTATRVPGAYFFCRTELLRTAIAQARDNPEPAVLAERLAVLVRERGLRMAYSPLVEAVLRTG